MEIRWVIAVREERPESTEKVLTGYGYFKTKEEANRKLEVLRRLPGNENRRFVLVQRPARPEHQAPRHKRRRGRR